MSREERIAKAREMGRETARRKATQRETDAAERSRRLGKLSPAEARRKARSVSRDAGVQVMGPHKAPTAWAEARAAVREAVIAAAREGRTINYAEIQLVAYEATGFKLGNFMMGRMCMEVNRRSDDCLLSSIIVRTDTGLPGDGFEPFARSEGYTDPLSALQRAVFDRFAP
jgi:hypothetical protein